jgi:hypothetical protein
MPRFAVLSSLAPRQSAGGMPISGYQPVRRKRPDYLNILSCEVFPNVMQNGIVCCGNANVDVTLHGIQDMCEHKVVSTVYVDEAVHQLQEGLGKIRHCLSQLDEQQIWWRPHEAQNSIANLMLHLGGNLRQWIISGVGGEPDVRNRPREFAERDSIPKEDLLHDLTATVNVAISFLYDHAAGRLLEIRRIQGFEKTILSAIFDSVAHFKSHVQEIISLTRQQLGRTYTFDFVPQTKEQGA